MSTHTQPAGVRYIVAMSDAQAHLWAVVLEIDRPALRQRLSLPVWIPGSYLVREFAQHLQELHAQADGQPVAIQALDKNHWEVQLPQDTARLTVRYRVYAFDRSVRTAYLDTQRGFFNPTSLCLRVHGREDEPHALTLLPGATTAGWQVATALPLADTPRPSTLTACRDGDAPLPWANGDGFTTYVASSYDELVDHPVEMGRLWWGDFRVRGIPHRLVLSGAIPAGVDAERLLRDTARVCEAAIAMWHGTEGTPPFDRYLFLLHITPGGYGGLEHACSTALIAAPTDLPLLPLPAAAAAADALGRSTDGSAPGRQDANTDAPAAGVASPATAPDDGYLTLLGLISHEYFHAWNVKRLRPRELARYDYDRENHTTLLWFFEGFTSYYDELLLVRAGLISADTFLQRLAKTINQVRDTPGRHIQSVAQASWDAWIRYYRPHENTSNATVSYYAKGALVALCLDLTLRREGHATLDDVMRALWQRCAGGLMREADLRAVLRQLGRRRYDAELNDWVHGTGELPLRELLEAHGVLWQESPAPLAQQLGIRVDDSATGLRLRHVLRGSAAEAAGLAAGDEWLAVERDGAIWRVLRLEDVALHARGLPPAAALTIWMARAGRILRGTLPWPAPTHTISLQPRTDAGTSAPWHTTPAPTGR